MMTNEPLLLRASESPSQAKGKGGVVGYARTRHLHFSVLGPKIVTSFLTGNVGRKGRTRNRTIREEASMPFPAFSIGE